MSTGGGGRGGRAPLADINVTPLVDVMLVLLIIFMVTAPMLTTGVDLDLPNAEAPAVETDSEAPTIHVILVPQEEQVPGGPTVRVLFNEEVVTLDQLEIALQNDEKIAEGSEVYVYGDTEVPYGEVVKVLARVRSQGIEKIGLMTDPLTQTDG